MAIVIIGTGLAGYTTARELRKHDTTTPLTLVTADSGRAYSKPMLSNGYRKEQAPGDLVQAEPDAMAETLDARVISGERVAGVAPDEGRVTLASGEVLSAEQVVLATGADPIEPPLAGDGGDRVFQINDLDQYEQFRNAAAGSRSVVIVGGGLIGCEFANDLAAAGYAVTMVFPEDRPLPRLLPERPAAGLRTGLEGLGVDMRSGRAVAQVDHQGSGVVATLDDGAQIEADLVLAAVGLRPRTGLAADAGLTVNRGICVDRYLATCHPQVFALGDCAEVEGYVLPYVAPLTNAARALGASLAGEPTPVHYPVMPVSVKTSCCQVVAWPPEPDAAGEWHCDGEAPDLRCDYRTPDGTLAGFALTGKRIKERMALTKAMPPLLE